MGNTIFGGGSALNKLKVIEQHLTRNSRTVYVDVDGNDDNDGSKLSPFATIARAMDEHAGTTAELTIYLENGVHDVFDFKLDIGRLIFDGNGSLRLNSSGNYLLFLNGGDLFIYCDLVVPTHSYYGFLLFQGASTILIKGASATVASSNFVVSAWGVSAVFFIDCNFSSLNPIVKFNDAQHSGEISFRELNTTYTNIL